MNRMMATLSLSSSQLADSREVKEEFIRLQAVSSKLTILQSFLIVFSYPKGTRKQGTQIATKAERGRPQGQSIL